MSSVILGSISINETGHCLILNLSSLFSHYLDVLRHLRQRTYVLLIFRRMPYRLLFSGYSSNVIASMQLLCLIIYSIQLCLVEYRVASYACYCHFFTYLYVSVALASVANQRPSGMLRGFLSNFSQSFNVMHFAFLA